MSEERAIDGEVQTRRRAIRALPSVVWTSPVAAVLMSISIYVNGYRLNVSADIAERFLIDKVVQGKAQLDRVGEWLETHMEAIE